MLFGSGNGSNFLPKGKLTKVDIDSLKSTITQSIYSNSGFYEVGISLDTSTGRNVALGHTISGVSAALYYYNRIIDGQTIELLRGVKFSLPVLNIDELPTESLGSPTNFEFLPQVVGIDSLYAMTIAGDIARTVTGEEKLWTVETYPVEVGGIGTEASSAELYGNIDGFWLGTWLRSDVGQDICMRMDCPINDPNNIKLSTLLGEYYGTIKVENRVLNMKSGFGTPLVANLRFSNLLGMLRSVNFRLNILIQSIIYQLLDSKLNGIEINEIGKSNFENTIKAYTAFESWCISEFGKLRDAIIMSRETGMGFNYCIDECSDLSYLSLSNYFICELSDTDLVLEADIKISDLATRDWLNSNLYT
jgi:hypothetical protein